MLPARLSLRQAVQMGVIFAALKLLIQIAGNMLAQHAGYGIFRDELYYRVCGQRLAFGYVDQLPLVALQARVTDMLFGHHTMWTLRLLSAVAGAAKVFLTSLLVWALGGTRRATWLAMLGVLVAGVYLGVDSYLSMNSFDPVFWMMATLALIRIVHHDEAARSGVVMPGASPRVIRNWWLVFGASAGLAFENKDSVAFFLVCLLAALLLTPERRILVSRWCAAAIGIIVLIALPNFSLAGSFPLPHPRVAAQCRSQR